MFRVHVVCEGPTDYHVLEAILDHHLEDFVLTQIQPESSLYGGDQGPFGGGWKGVRNWCRAVAEKGGLEASGRLVNADLLILHLDADVADDHEVACARPCPPPSATIDILSEVVLGWLGETTMPNRVVFCIPSKSTEAWVLAALHPDDSRVVPCDPPPREGQCLECRDEPAALLIGKAPRLVRRKQGKLRKQKQLYKKSTPRLTRAWPRVQKVCTTAERFDTELRAALLPA